MALDFDREKIEIRYFTQDYGPYIFDFEDALPSSTTIASVTLKSYLGKIDPSDDLSGETETTSECVDAFKTAVNGDYGVAAYFDFPSTVAWQDQKHTLIFELTLSNAAKHPFYFQYLDVK